MTESEKLLEKEILEGYSVPKNALERNTEPRENVGTTTKSGYERAKPKIHGYRERFKAGKLKPSDVMVLDRKFPNVKQFDPAASDEGAGGIIRGQYGYNPWFGEGTQIDF